MNRPRGNLRFRISPGESVPNAAGRFVKRPYVVCVSCAAERNSAASTRRGDSYPIQGTSESPAGEICVFTSAPANPYPLPRGAS